MWRLRIAAICAALTGLAFLQQPGLTAADSKTDLVVEPARWLARSLHVWDPAGAFGQLQNQAYGYLWPMGPFFVLGDWSGIPAWAVQRLWWALLMCLAFTGVVMLAERLRIGTPATRLIAGVAFALSPRLLTEMGPISVEAWPSALAPWVLVPLAALSRGMAARRAVALSAVAVACAGGANATAVLAVVPLAVLLLAARPVPVRRRLAVIAAWCAAVGAATAWWVVPLLLLGRYSPPFLDYIETSAVTTRVTDTTTVLRGASHWLGFYREVYGPAWPAGWRLATEPWLVAATLVVAGLGVAGLARRGMPHRRFLIAGLLSGLALVGLGHVGTVDGLAAGLQQQFLDGAGAPLRNVHKFDVVLRLPLILGLAHLLGVLHRSAAAAGGGWHVTRRRAVAVTAAAVAAIIGCATPAIAGGLPNRGSFAQVPGYWREATTWLDRHLDHDRVLVVPAARFPRYTWGSPTDEVVQTLLQGSWAVRGAIPLTPPTTIRLLDAVDAALATGAGSAGLADLLARSGVRYLLVRSDLNYGATGSARPLVVRQALDRSPGLRPVAAFGPIVGNNKLFGGFVDEGMDVPVRALEIVEVGRTVDRVVAYETDSVTTVVGGPESLLDLAAAGRLSDAPAVLAGDLAGRLPFGPVAVTDGLRRREVAFGLASDGVSSTMDSDESFQLGTPAPDFLPAWGAGQSTVVRYEGARSVTASSSWSQANPLSGARPEHHPYAALDGDPATSWRSAPGSVPAQQWFEVEFAAPRTVEEVKLQFDLAADAQPLRVTVRAGTERASTDVVDGAAEVHLDGVHATRRVRITFDSVSVGYQYNSIGLAELKIPGLEVQRTLVPPHPPASDRPATVVVTAASSVPSCFFIDDQPRCADGVSRASEDADRIDRLVQLPAGGTYTTELWVRPRPGPALDALLDARRETTTPREGAATVTASSTRLPHPAARPGVVLDGDPATAWLPSVNDPAPWLRVAWPQQRTISGLRLTAHAEVAAGRPARVQVVGDDGPRAGTLDEEGRVVFDRPMRTDDITVLFPPGFPVTSYDPYSNRFESLPVGVGELIVLPGAQNPLPKLDQRVELPCGQGPPVEVGGVLMPTAVTATVRDLIQLRDVKARVCTDARTKLTLGAGDTRLTAIASAAFTPVRLALSPEQASDARVVAAPVRVDGWSATRRRVHLEPHDKELLLAVRENSNAGWQATMAGQRLTPITVDGWQQGWLVPPGEHGEIVLSFAPDLQYRGGMAIGAGLLAVVVLLALPWRRRKGPLPVAGRGAGLVPAIVGAAALLLVGGVAAVAMVVVGLAVLVLHGVLWKHLSDRDQRRMRVLTRTLAWLLPVACFAVAGWQSTASADPHTAALPQLAAVATATALWLSTVVPARRRGHRTPQR